MRLPEGCSNSSLLWKIIYFATSRSFSCIVSELEKYVQQKFKKIIKKSRSFEGPFIRTVLINVLMAVAMVVFVVAMMKLILERIPKQNIYMRIKENYIPP